MSVRVRVIFLSIAAMALSPPLTSVAQTTVTTGPRGGAVARGPNGAAVRGPNGAAAARGPNGAAVRGPYGGAAAVGPNGAAGRGPNGGVAVAGRPAYGARSSRTFHYGGRPFYGVYARPFVYPPGWAYRRWVVGAALPALFLTSAYYYTGYAAMGLPPPAAGHQWVRYGPDLLLVDLRTGVVIHTAHGVFE